MKTKDIDRIEKQMRDILKEREVRIKELNQTIADQQNKKEEAKKALKDATDLDSYRAIKEQIRGAEDTIEFCNMESMRLHARKDVPDNDGKQIKTMITQVQKETNDNFDDSAKRIIGELRSLVYEYRKLNTRIDNCRDLLCNHVVSGETRPIARTQVSGWYLQLDSFIKRLDDAIKYKVLQP